MNNREIKFRAWDKDFREMFYRDNLTIFSWNLESHELMQFTGLLDKNGNEIFEGDIVEREIEKVMGDSRSSVLRKITQRKVIEWNDDKKDAPVGFNITPFRSDNGWRVVGNIYENEDLVVNKGE